MLRCKACPRRCIGTVFADIANTGHFSHQNLPLKSLSRATSRPRQGYATEATSFDNLPSSNPTLDVGVRNPYLPQLSHKPKRNELFSRTSLELEVRWLRDPLKLGDHVVRLLGKDDYQKALAIVEVASKDVQCTVSWNYLIDYLMSKGKVADAVKKYNQMKKRAQSPDAHTFTTLFRGFSWHYKNPGLLAHALSIYHSMFADNSRVRPSIIHTNAVLKVCALAGNMDALLGVAAKLPNRGAGAPNHLTFTTILNAIRTEAGNSTKPEEDGPAKRERLLRAVMQGRRLWEEMRERWIGGDLRLDEELVCALGRLMLLADDVQDCDDVLSLVEQTMGVPRQIPRRGQPGRRGVRRNLAALDVSADADLPSLDEMVPTLQEDVSSREDPSDSESDPFALLPNVSSRLKAKVQPGRSTLSLVLDACIRIRVVRAAQNYWGLLTDPSGLYKIDPDTENYHMYLRLLRVQRASKLAVELINEMRQGAVGPQTTLQTKTFRIGLSCCLRDHNNKNSLQHAAKLVRLMNDTLEFPDARALGMYLRLGLAQEPRDWRTLMGILRGTEFGIRNLRSLLAFDPEQGKKHSKDIEDLVKTTIGMTDVILDLGNEELTDDERRVCQERKYTLQAYITKRANQDRAIKESRKIREAPARQNQDEAGDGDVDVGESDPRQSLRRVAESQKKQERWQRNRKKWKDNSVAASWERFIDD